MAFFFAHAILAPRERCKGREEGAPRNRFGLLRTAFLHTRSWLHVNAPRVAERVRLATRSPAPERLSRWMLRLLSRTAAQTSRPGLVGNRGWSLMGRLTIRAWASTVREKAGSSTEEMPDRGVRRAHVCNGADWTRHRRASARAHRMRRSATVKPSIGYMFSPSPRETKALE